MRQGIYELSVFDKSGLKFHECELDGKNYLRAEGGKEYDVHFTIHPDAAGNFPYAVVICILTIDGCQINEGYYENLRSGPLNMPRVIKFCGTQISRDSVQAFMFSDVEVSTLTNGNNSKAVDQMGHIHVAVYEAFRTQRPVNYNGTFNSKAAPSSIAEGKKFWQQPSLATSLGSLKTQ